VEDGVPDEAFTAVTGDDKEVAKAIKKRNREERKGQPSLPFDVAQHVHAYATDYQKLTAIAEDTPTGVRQKASAYQTSRRQEDWWHDWTACNIWTAAFFVPLTKFDDSTVPTHERLLRFVERQDSQPQMAAAANALSEQLRFFHWGLEFPEVFEKGGFDTVLGNPPWERLNIQEKEFFASRAPAVSKAANKAARSQLLRQLAISNPDLWRDYQSAVRSSASLDKFIRGSMRFVLTAQGDINTYAIFAELGRTVVNNIGRSGMVLPIGIATDDTTSDFFSDLVGKANLVQLLGFENERFIFPEVHHSFKFCALTIAGSSDAARAISFCFFCREFSQVVDTNRRFGMNAADLKLLSPTTQSCPVFRTGMDANLTRKIYRSVPVLADDKKNDGWRVQLRRMFHMSDDSDKFRTVVDLEREGAVRTGSLMHTDEQVWLPLYEAKMIYQFDHRFATFEGATQASLNAGILPQCSQIDKMSAVFSVTPRYWVLKSEVDTKIGNWSKPWLVGFRDVTSAIAERTAVFCLMPRVAVGHSCPLAYFPDAPLQNVLMFLANVNSMVFDYTVRQKLGGNHLTFSVLNQVPVLRPSAYHASDTRFITDRVLELVYTADDISGFALELGFEGPPFEWSDERRSNIRAELDAYYAHLYSLTRDELRYILDPKDVLGQDFPSETFRVLKEREEQEFGEYRTRRLVLEAFDRLAESSRFRDEMPKRISAFSELRQVAEVSS
jgi:hypothetical protein